ncbi:MAG: lactonase family protein [Gammaproteobacteria bacterium]
MNSKILTGVLSAALLIVSVGRVAADSAQHRHEDAVGAVYTMTNAADGNRVVIFDRYENGTLTKTGSVATGGTGSGGGFDPLASQNSLILSPDNRWLLAVNGGSHEISVFRVVPDGLTWVSKVDSGGSFPVSLTIDHDRVFVLNAGATANITGFTLNRQGQLIPLPYSTRALGTGAFSQVGFDPEGEALIVTDRADNTILVYAVDEESLPAQSPVTSISNGQVPFGFIFDARGNLLVIEVGPNAVSSYKISDQGELQVISGSEPNGQKAACWIARDARGDVFTSNPGSGTISAYKTLLRSGQVALLNGAAGSGSKPLDIAVAGNGLFLYAADPGNGSVDMFRITHDGGLTNLGTVNGGLALFAQGIAAR